MNSDVSTPGALAPAVTVHLFAGAAAEYGADLTTVRGATLQQVIEGLLDGVPDRARQVIGRCSFLVNSVACRDTGRALAEGDRVDVLPPFAGG